MDLTTELEQFNGLLSFLIKFGCYYIPTIIGALVSYCTKTSKTKKKKKGKVKGQFGTFLIQVFAFSITPAFLITAACSLLASNIGDSTIIYGIAFICGAVGEDVTNAFTSLRTINRVTNKVSESVQCLKGVAAMTGAMLPEDEEDSSKSSESNTGQTNAETLQVIEDIPTQDSPLEEENDEEPQIEEPDQCIDTFEDG